MHTCVNRYCRHCVTNISQGNSINRNRKKLNEVHDDEWFFVFFTSARAAQK